MIEEDNKNIINGPTPLQPLLKITLGKLIFDSLIRTRKKEALV